MNGLRNEPKAEIAGLKVLEVQDYALGYNGLPKSNVLRYVLENNCWVCVRQTGTEPKIKFYFGANGKDEAEAAEYAKKLQAEMTAGF
jgi:phosphoglucomutase